MVNSSHFPSSLPSAPIPFLLPCIFLGGSGRRLAVSGVSDGSAVVRRVAGGEGFWKLPRRIGLPAIFEVVDKYFVRKIA